MMFVFDIRSTLVITLPLVQLESGTPANNVPTANQRCPQQTQTILIWCDQAMARLILCLNPQPFLWNKLFVQKYAWMGQKKRKSGGNRRKRHFSKQKEMSIELKSPNIQHICLCWLKACFTQTYWVIDISFNGLVCACMLLHGVHWVASNWRHFRT